MLLPYLFTKIWNNRPDGSPKKFNNFANSNVDIKQNAMKTNISERIAALREAMKQRHSAALTLRQSVYGCGGRVVLEPLIEPVQCAFGQLGGLVEVLINRFLRLYRHCIAVSRHAALEICGGKLAFLADTEVTYLFGVCAESLFNEVHTMQRAINAVSAHAYNIQPVHAEMTFLPIVKLQNAFRSEPLYFLPYFHEYTPLTCCKNLCIAAFCGRF